jgi:predicted O-methyltransferase YrrM
LLRPDPFAIKSKPKWHPSRLVRTAWMRWEERMARTSFDKSVIPQKQRNGILPAPDADWDDTAVTPLQMSYLLAALRQTESLADGVVVEIGSYRGVTTRCFAQATPGPIIAIDPYIGYGGSEADLSKFMANTAGLPNIVHIRQTSGRAFADWPHGAARFVFIDAVHDYANTSHDLDAWSSLLMPGGIVALHDTDNPQFSGTRRAAFEALNRFELYAHLKDLVLFRKAAANP